jgi:hypothetical protein
LDDKAFVRLLSVTGVAGHEETHRHPLTNRVALYMSTPERCRDISGHRAVCERRSIACKSGKVFALCWKRLTSELFVNAWTFDRRSEITIKNLILHLGALLFFNI